MQHRFPRFLIPLLIGLGSVLSALGGAWAQASLNVTVCSPAEGGCFVVSGRKLPAIGARWDPAQTSTGAPWVLVPVGCAVDDLGASIDVWQAPNRFDYEVVDARLRQVLEANPGAYLIPVISVNSPEWWNRAHPGELMVSGNTLKGHSIRCASWASPVWRKDAGQAVKHLVEHLESSPFAAVIIGYQLASGEDGQWIYPGTAQGLLADYSKAQQSAFRAWLKNKYQDIQSLRIAWGQPAQPVTTPEAVREQQTILGWSQAAIPSAMRRLSEAEGVLHEPSASQEVVDYQTFCSDLVVETIRLLAASVREVVGTRKVVGTSYGPVFDLAATKYGLTVGGQLSLSPLVQADELDFIVTDASRVGASDLPLLTTVSASIANHDKLWVMTAPAGRAPVLGGLCSGAAVAQVSYQAAQWASLSDTLKVGRASAAEIAVVFDDISATYLTASADLSKPLLSDQRIGLALLGAPFDVWLLDDVMAGRAPHYKMYVFLDAFCMDAQARQQLLDVLGTEKCLAVWIYAAGAIDQAISGRGMKDLTGFTIAMRRGKGPLRVQVGDSSGYTYGAEAALMPRFASVDDSKDIRGRLAGATFGGLVAGTMGEVTSVWSAAPHLPAGLLRSLAEEAGVHLYVDPGDAVFAAGDLLVIRAGRDGAHAVRLPTARRVRDLLSGKDVGMGQAFGISLKAGTIGIYQMGPAGTLP